MVNIVQQFHRTEDICGPTQNFSYVNTVNGRKCTSALSEYNYMKNPVLLTLHYLFYITHFTCPVSSPVCIISRLCIATWHQNIVDFSSTLCLIPYRIFKL